MYLATARIQNSHIFIFQQSYRMNQPLAHLYFLTLLESFLKLYGGHEVTYLATIVQRIDEVCSVKIYF